MVPVVLSILVVVLISAAALWLAAGDVDKPTSERNVPAEPAPRVVDVAPVAPAPGPQRAPVRLARAPLPRHRARSSVLLVLLIAVVGVLLAIVVGAVLAALAFVLRAALTS